MKFSPTGDFILSGSYDHSVILWNLRGEVVRQIIEHVDYVNAVCFSPDGASFFSAGGKSKAKGMFHIENGRIDVNQVDGDENSFYRWSMNDPKIKTKFLKHSARITSMDISPSGELAITGTAGWFHVWDLKAGSLKKSISADNWRYVLFAGNEKKVLTKGLGISMWDISSEKKLWEYERDIKGYSLGLSPDYSLITAVNYDGGIIILDSKTGKLILEVERWDILHPNEQFTFITFSPDGNYLLAGKDNGKVQVFRYPSLESVIELVGHSESVIAASFSPNSRFVIASGSDHAISLWEVDWQYEF